jgi:hypothetical protein
VGLRNKNSKTIKYHNADVEPSLLGSYPCPIGMLGKVTRGFFAAQHAIHVLEHSETA